MTRQFACLVLLMEAAVLGGGCSPELLNKDVGSRWYRSSARCSQGPYDFEVRAKGSRWGEHIALRAHSPRDIQGFYRVEVDGRVYRSGRFGEGKMAVTRKEGATPENPNHYYRVIQWVAVKRPQNSRCVAQAGEEGRATAVTEPAPGPGAAGKPTDPARRAAAAPVSAARTDLVALGDEERRLERQVLQRGQYETLFDFRISPTLGREVRLGTDQCLTDTTRMNEFHKGAKIRIRIWSAQPNDLEGVIFKLEHSVYQPNVSAKRWIAHLNRKLKCQSKRRKRQDRKAQPPRPERRVCIIGKGFRRPQGMRFTHWIKTSCHCSNRMQDPVCWGPKGFFAWADANLAKSPQGDCEFQQHFYQTGKRFEIRVKRQCRCADQPRDAACFGASGYRAFMLAQVTKRIDELARQRAELEKDRRQEALRRAPPPPRPMLDVRPPRPSRHAIWIAGYWVWNGQRYGWIRGWWRVPAQDVSAGLTTRASKPPPPAPRADPRPPRPVLQAVWTPGSWRWNGRGYVWYRGSWRIPPTGRHQWRRPRWQRIRGGVIFLPGGWTVRTP
ncbi:MAG: YXWGXW repeat-containing protein [bacterium]